jgi:hypothetical protein
MAKPKKTEAEIADDNERTNSMGLFNTAEAYWKSGAALQKAKVKSGHADSPVRFLYYHAIELYLKALLRQHYSVDKLADKFGHKTKKLMRAAEEVGLMFMDEDKEVFSIMGDTNAVIRVRYIKTGTATWPTFEALDRTCKSLRTSVGAALRKAGVMVRL